MTHNSQIEVNFKEGQYVESNDHEQELLDQQNLKVRPEDETFQPSICHDPLNAENLSNKKKSFTRSLRQRVDTYSISFENGILDQHEEGLKNIVKKFLEKLFQFETEVREFNQELFDKYNFTSNTNAILANEIKQNKWITQQDKKIFIQDVHNQEQFDKFLQFVSQTYSKEVFAELLWVFYLIWLKYVEVRSKLSTEATYSKNAQQFAQEQAENIFVDLDVQFINLRAKNIESNLTEQQIFDAFKIFLKQICETVFLVIDGFFANPYYEPKTEFPKRSYEQTNSFFMIDRDSFGQSSDDQQDSFLHGHPRKRRK